MTLCEGVEGGEDGFGMVLDLNLGEDAADDPLAINDESGALDTHVLAAVERLFDVNTKGLGDLVARITEQREIELVPGDKAVVQGGGVAADANDFGPGLAQLGLMVTEVAGLGGASVGEILGVEVKDEGALGGQVFEAKSRAILGG